jgi:tRNA(Ile)-lysidine synthase
MLIEKVARSIRRFGMIRSEDRVLIAISGGPDSVALTHALVELAGTQKFELRLGHLNHQLREEADSDEAFCAGVADQLALPFASHRIDVARESRRNGYSIEEQARVSRYRFLRQTAERWGCKRVAVGHTQDDQAETFLLRLLRGSGVTGLAAIRPVVPMGLPAPETTQLIRPMLEVTHSEVLGFLNSRGLAYRQDRTNLDRSIPRNSIRHEVLPFLARHYNPNLRDTLARTADLLRQDEEWMEQEATGALAEMTRSEGDRLWLSAPGLDRLHPALRRRVVRGAISRVRGDLRAVTSRHIEDVLALTNPNRSGRRLCLPGLDCGRSFDAIWFQATNPARREARGYNGYEYALTVPGELAIPEAGGALRAVEAKPTSLPAAAGATVKVALGEGDGPLSPLRMLRVRSPRPGDRFRPLGAPGSKTVSRYLMERRVDRNRRGLVPLVIGSDRKILWVVGHGVSEASRVTPGAGRVLELSWLTA